MPLNTSLVAFWPLNEASGARSELVNGYTLTDNNTVGSASGRVYGTAANFVQANAEYLSVASNADLTIGNNDATVALWVYLDDFSYGYQFCGRSVIGGGLEWLIEYSTAEGRFRVRACSAAGDVNLTSVTDGGGFGGGNAPSTGTWYLIVFDHDAAGNTLGIRSNANGFTRYTQAYSFGIWESGADLNIGRPGNYFPTYADAVIGPMMMWKRLLTVTEIQEIYNYGRGLTYSQLLDPVDLITDLVSFWELEEASGVRSDAHGSNDLTDNNTVGSASGKVGTAADFEVSNNEYLSRPTNASLETGDIDFTFAAWVNLESANPAVVHSIVGKITGGLATEYHLYYYPAYEDFFFEVAGGYIQTVGTSSVGTWYFVVGWHDSVNDQLAISLNGGSPVTVSHATGATINAADFGIGRAIQGFSAYDFDGLIDQVGFWKRLLTYSEIQALYNADAGLAYSDISGQVLGSPFWWNQFGSPVMAVH